MKPFTLLLAILLILGLPLCGLAAGAPDLGPGTLIPMDIPLPKGQKFTVYSGPGERYTQTGTVATNGWVQVFGYTRPSFEWDKAVDGTPIDREATWLLIHYGTDSGRMRFGYIKVPNEWREKNNMLALYERALPLSELWVLKNPVEITDDPVGSKEAMASLPAGTQIKLSTRMGKWAYGEVMHEDKLMRGFVPNLALAPIAWRDESRPFDLRVTSWGPMVFDYAVSQDKYTYFFSIKKKPDENEERGPNVELELRPYNTWVRLDSTESRASLETLSDFRVIEGRAICQPFPIKLMTFTYLQDIGTSDYTHYQFLPKNGFNRAALYVQLEDGEDINNVTLACTRTSIEEKTETIVLPLRGIPMDMGYPKGGAVFTLNTFERYPEQSEFIKGKTTLKTALEHETMPMPDLPKAIADLPYDTQRYTLYWLNGEIQKKHGDFGVYDVTFALENPPEGIYSSVYEKNVNYGAEISKFDMTGDDVYLPDGLVDYYDDDHQKKEEELTESLYLLLLADTEKYSPSQIKDVIRNLKITATFSGEKWDMFYQSEISTSAIGPRSSEYINLSSITEGKGTYKPPDKRY